MSKSLKIYVALLALLLLFVIAVDASKPKPVNWTPTYDLKGKEPFGLYVLDRELPKLNPNRKVSRFYQTPYQYLDPLYDYDSLVHDYKIHGILMAIGAHSSLDKASAEELLYFASHGNTAFLSMADFPETLQDSLKFDLSHTTTYSPTTENWTATEAQKHYLLTEGASPTYFSSLDSATTAVLGYLKDGDSAKPNLIRVRFHQGEVILHSQPAAFTNIHLLQDDHAPYAAAVLSELPNQNIYWWADDAQARQRNSSPIAYFISKPAFAWAWYLLIFGTLVFVLFNAKRRQRVVPIIKPLRNSTVEFAKTIGNLYLQEGNHGNLAEKKIIYFLEKIRQDYLMETLILDASFIRKLQQKSGKNYQDIEKVVYLINTFRKQRFSLSEDDLIALNTAIEKISS